MKLKTKKALIQRARENNFDVRGILWGDSQICRNCKESCINCLADWGNLYHKLFWFAKN